MTIRKRVDWGHEAPRPDGLETLDDDAAVRRLVESMRHRDQPIPPFVVRHGGLARTVGAAGRPLDLDAERWRMLPIDVARIEIDDEPHWFVAHAVLRRSWWRGPVVAGMNAQFIGTWDVAPRSHPNDGRLDVIEVDDRMTIRQRSQARRRLATGAHLPHPLISERRLRRQSWTFDSPVRVWLDGERVGTGRRIVVESEPDAAVMCVPT